MVFCSIAGKAGNCLQTSVSGYDQYLMFLFADRLLSGNAYRWLVFVHQMKNSGRRIHVISKMTTKRSTVISDTTYSGVNQSGTVFKKVAKEGYQKLTVFDAGDSDKR